MTQPHDSPRDTKVSTLPFCAQCGVGLQPSDKFCGGCGQPVALKGAAPPPPQRAPRPAGQPGPGMHQVKKVEVTVAKAPDGLFA
ncbi:MAG: hypothetical protein ACK46X_07915, partial [Candidatus Sericytochromatia bacterium]